MNRGVMLTAACAMLAIASVAGADATIVDGRASVTVSPPRGLPVSRVARLVSELGSDARAWWLPFPAGGSGVELSMAGGSAIAQADGIDQCTGAMDGNGFATVEGLYSGNGRGWAYIQVSLQCDERYSLYISPSAGAVMRVGFGRMVSGRWVWHSTQSESLTTPGDYTVIGSDWCKPPSGYKFAIGFEHTRYMPGNTYYSASLRLADTTPHAAIDPAR